MLLITFITLLLGTYSYAGTSVVHEDGVYTIDNSFDVEAPVYKVREVLTDYNHLAEFVPYVESSVIVSTEPFTLVDQRIVARCWFFSKRVHVGLKVDQGDTYVSFTDTSYEDFDLYEGYWYLEDMGSYTRVSSRIHISPKFSLPAFILKGALQDSVNTFVDLVQKEVYRRGF